MASKTKKKTSRKRGATTNRAKTTKARQNDFINEVILWVILAISIILFISNFGIGGFIGNTISANLFGIFGLLAYIFPVFLFLFVAFFLSNKGNKIAWIKIIAGVILLWCLCLFFQLLGDKNHTMSPIEAFNFSKRTKESGGFIGGVFEFILYPNFGLISSYIIDIILMVISFILLTEKSIMSVMKKASSLVYQSARTNAKKRKIKNQKKREQRAYERELEEARLDEELEQMRMNKKAYGVAFNTKIDHKQLSSSDDMSEMVSDVMQDQTQQVSKEINEHTQQQQATSFSNSLDNEYEIKQEDIQENMQNNQQEDELPALEIEGIFDDISPKTDFAKTEDSSPLDQFDKVDLFEEKQNALYHENEIDENESFDLEEEKNPKTYATKTKDLQQEQDVSSMAQGMKHQPKQSKQEIDETIHELSNEIQDKPVIKKYVFPSVSLLNPIDKSASGDTKTYLQETALKLQQTLKNFGVNVSMTNVSCGPAVTRYELQPEMGVKVSKIVNLADDIKLNLAAADIRIEAPIPGKAAIGIEVPNKKSVPVMFRELIESEAFKSAKSNLSFAAGKDIAGNVVITDIAKMPHLLIAGATGSGKSVCINTIIMSILYKAHPDQVKLIMIDPKVVELSVYNGIPHLMIPVVTDPKKAAAALHWAVSEMTDRYQKFAEYNVRDINGYNKKIEAIEDINEEGKPKSLPHLVIIVDELADLMMVAPGDVEDAICRLAQLARAAGIHLVIATQRPSVNVITGLIKANMPSRIAFSVTSGVDSRTILDMNGAEKLLGKGDMLFYPQGIPKPKRVQGAFVTDSEVSNVVDFLKDNNGVGVYNSSIEEKLNATSDNTSTMISDSDANSNEKDSYFLEAAKLMVDKEKGSIGIMQRYLKIGFNRAARIMDQLEEAGIVGPEEGTKPRRVLMTQEQLDVYIEENL